jgi:hypothetical protein
MCAALGQALYIQVMDRKSLGLDLVVDRFLFNVEGMAALINRTSAQGEHRILARVWPCGFYVNRDIKLFRVGRVHGMLNLHQIR